MHMHSISTWRRQHTHESRISNHFRIHLEWNAWPHPNLMNLLCSVSSSRQMQHSDIAMRSTLQCWRYVISANIYAELNIDVIMKHHTHQSEYAQIQQFTHYAVGNVACAWWCVSIAILTALLVFSLASNVFYAFLYFQRINELCDQTDTALQSHTSSSLLPFQSQHDGSYDCCDRCR